MAHSNFNKMNNINIMFWNVHSVNQRKAEINKLIQNIDILVCVETWLKPDLRFNISGYNSFRKDRPGVDRGGGIVYFVRKDLIFTEITQVTSQTNTIEITGIRINNIQPAIDIIACYRRPGITLSQSEWNEILNTTKHNSSSILLGDFNAHNNKWNCPSSDTNGERLDCSIELHNLFLHNPNTFTHINYHNSERSNIDLVFSTLNIAEKVNTHVFDEMFGSDHFPILIDVQINKKFQYEKKKL